MAKPFDLELKNIQKNLKNEMQIEIDERKEIVKKSVCPSCNQTMVDSGCMTIKNLSEANKELEGDYCLSCYYRWLTKFVPKYEQKSNLLV